MFRSSIVYPYYPADQHAGVLRAVQDCEVVCENTFSAVLRRPDGTARATQLQLLRDCADICTLTAKMIARCSIFARHTAALCAQICEICGNHCLRMPDPESQYCGRVCLNCARECRAFAGTAAYPYPGYHDPGYPHHPGYGPGYDFYSDQGEKKEE